MCQKSVRVSKQNEYNAKGNVKSQLIPLSYKKGVEREAKQSKVFAMYHIKSRAATKLTIQNKNRQTGKDEKNKQAPKNK